MTTTDDQVRKPTYRPRIHPAKRAHAVALVSSIAATGGITMAMAAADRAGDSGELITAAAVASTPAATAPTTGATAATPTTTRSGATPTTTATAAPSTRSAAASASTTTRATTTAPASADGVYADGTWTGTAQYTKWGNVQVRVTVQGGAIVDVATLQMPTDNKSSAINSRAVPRLEAQAVALQSADLDIVSGATYTSRTYATSLQSALDASASEVVP